MNEADEVLQIFDVAIRLTKLGAFNDYQSNRASR